MNDHQGEEKDGSSRWVWRMFLSFERAVRSQLRFSFSRRFSIETIDKIK